MTTRYELIIYWSKDDDSFVVEVPELPGCMADGQNYAEAVANAEVVIAEWIETARSVRDRFTGQSIRHGLRDEIELSSHPLDRADVS